ncbi:MAG: PQQ-binding-like beta-propeller repeat protein, partial [Chitinophagaceae bacterium]|nr:PQQ-binding-like beta-propeller repeat protein [Chitinophagaceae bacterium]
ICLIVLLPFIFSACTKPIDQTIDDYFNNLPPSPFKVYVDERGVSHAVIHWDPETKANPDSISYSVELDGVTVASGLDTTVYRLTNITTKNYNGAVIAHEPKNSSFAAPFQLNAIDGFSYLYTGNTLIKAPLDSVFIPTWTFNFPSEMSIYPGPALVAGDTLFFTTSAHFFAINKKTGAEFWRKEIGNSSTSFVYTPGKVYIARSANSKLQLIALNTATQNIDWSYDTDGSFNPANAGPVLAHNTLYVSAFHLWAVDLNGNFKWKVMSQNLPSSYVSAGANNVYFTDERGVNCVDANTGQIKWSKWRFNVESDYVSEYRNIVYPLNHIFIYGIDATTGSTVWEYNPEATTVTLSAPATRGDTIYLAVQAFPDLKGSVMAFHYKTGKVFWTTKLPDPYSNMAVSHLVVVGNRLYVSNILELNADDGSILRKFFTEGRPMGVIEMSGKNYHSNTKHGFGD